MPMPLRPLRRLLPLLLLTAAPAAIAQSPTGATVERLPRPGDPAELLAQALRTLAVEPNNLQALTAAGHDALALGDPNAAVGFFGRAQEIAPRDGVVKAGLGSALVDLEKPQDALRLFGEASRLGVPDADFAADRGLAYDLTGDPRKAQRDYAMVLAAHPDDDLIRRRLALSQGISGDKAAAIATLDPLIRKRDIAGWRAQTFVLAMNGDAKGASDITHIMLPQQADMLQPFLVRLATLSPADKARAVNFGEMPAAGRAYTPTELANTGAAPTYAGSATRSATTAAAAPTPIRRAARVAMAMPTPVAANPAPAVVAPVPTAPAATSTAPLAATAPAPAMPAAVPIEPAARPAPVAVARADPAPSVTSGLATPELPIAASAGHYDLPHDPAARGASRPAPVVAPTAAARVAAAPPVSGTRTVGTPVVHGHPGKPVADATPVEAPAKHGKAKPATAATDDSEPAPDTRKTSHGKLPAEEVASAKSDRKAMHGKAGASDEDDGATRSRKGAHGKPAPDEGDDGGAPKSRKPLHGKKGADEEGDTGSAHAKKAEKAEKPEPERVFVQVAGGANKDDMDKAWAGVKKKAPELMKGRTPQTAPVHATNRLLVGPFKSEDEAQAFVNKMAGKGLSGFTVKTGKHDKVEKVGVEKVGVEKVDSGQ